MSEKLPEFEKPPLIEVVCGVNFRTLDKLLLPHIGIFWDRLRSSFPTCEEKPPLAIALERTASQPPSMQEITFSDSPPLPRVWFIDSPGNGIIQVQRDAFLYNWRKLTDEDAYPRFRNVFQKFETHLASFRKFLSDFSLGEIAPIQFELTYVNHIFRDGINEEGENLDIERLFPDFCWRRDRDRFLTKYDGINLKMAFLLPNDSGRLQISVHTANRVSDKRPLIVMELRARGVGSKRSIDELHAWFEMAHEWIVRGFADYTATDIQKKQWRRIV